jgi:hypothetical protein
MKAININKPAISNINGIIAINSFLKIYNNHATP